MSASSPASLLAEALTGARPFALIRREADLDHVLVAVGDLVTVDLLADLPLRPGRVGPDLLALIPYRQLVERGDACHDDATPLQALRIESSASVPVAAVLEAIVDDGAGLVPGGFDTAERRVAKGRHFDTAERRVVKECHFDTDDDSYATTVKRVLDEEIAAGEGANFVIHRTFQALADREPLGFALQAFRRLVVGERNAYWTFCVHTPELTLVGASPERHVSAERGSVWMNPISGTFRRPPGSVPTEDVLAFLADAKETDELAMVLDEELKMMAAVGDLGGRVVGPFLKEMARLAHTEYLIEARTSLDVRDVLRRTMFAPTVTGSPLRNALRVIARHETVGRGYYAGVAALIGHDPDGMQTLDAPILIRTAYVDAEGGVRVPVGATLVKDSDPAGEVLETVAKSAAVIASLTGAVDGRSTDAAPAGVDTVLKTASGTVTASLSASAVHADDPRVRAALEARNDRLAPFWSTLQGERALTVPAVEGRRVLVLDHEDDFTAMLLVQLRALGLAVELLPGEEFHTTEGYDVVVLGPGPGDPRDIEGSARMRTLRKVAHHLLDTRTPTLGICLGHQHLAAALGLELVRLDRPRQGVQKQIDYFGRPEDVGFYNSYAALAGDGPLVAADEQTGHVHAMRGPAYAGFQFHPESVLSRDGIGLLAGELVRLVAEG
jgi:2-amino-4-deoxychorismate synthase